MRSAFLRALIACLIAAIALTACGGSAQAPAAPASGGGAPAPTRAPAANPTSAQAVTLSPTGAAPENVTAGKGPAWLDTPLTDVNSGQAFKLSDFRGQIVLVEGMAVWCVNCLRQQRELVRLHQQIGDAAISVSIDVDLNEDEPLLKRHAEVNGFTWRYAIATPELARAFADEFGNTFLNPPSVPMFLIDKQGGVHLLDFGQKTVEYLTAQIQSYQ